MFAFHLENLKQGEEEKENPFFGAREKILYFSLLNLVFFFFFLPDNSSTTYIAYGVRWERS